MTKVLIFIISWFLIGFLTGIIACCIELRGKEFNIDYFDSDFVKSIFCAIIMGCITPLLVGSICVSDYIKSHNLINKSKKHIARFMYWLANIGYKSKQDTSFEDDVVNLFNQKLICPKCSKELLMKSFYQEDDLTCALCHCEECLDDIDSDWEAILKKDGSVEIKRFFFG